MKIKRSLSPNYSDKTRQKERIKFVIIHYTGMQSEIESKKKLKNKKIGMYKLTYKNKKLILQNDIDQIIFDLHKIKYPVNTMRHSFSFDYEDITYNFTDIRHQFVLYEMCRFINGSYKE